MLIFLVKSSHGIPVPGVCLLIKFLFTEVDMDTEMNYAEQFRVVLLSNYRGSRLITISKRHTYLIWTRFWQYSRPCVIISSYHFYLIQTIFFLLSARSRTRACPRSSLRPNFRCNTRTWSRASRWSWSLSCIRRYRSRPRFLTIKGYRALQS